MGRTVSGPELQTKNEKLFESLADEWVDKLNMWEWELHFRFQSTQDFFRDDPDAPVETLANCVADWQYMRATIGVNKGKLEEASKRDIEVTIIHELLHALINEMREESVKHEERVVTLLARALYKIKEEK